MLHTLPSAKELLADRGDDAAWFRKALLEKGIIPCIPSRRNRKETVRYDKELYKQRHKIERVFSRLKDGAELPCAMTDVPTPFFLLSVSR